MSGSKSCDGAGEVCSKLALAPGHLARWTCDGVNPYKADIPVGTVCQAVYVQTDPGCSFFLTSMALFIVLIFMNLHIRVKCIYQFLIS